MSGPVVVAASAPTRICDTGGWTDTWFAGHGVVCNVAVEPSVRVEVRARREQGAPRLVTGAIGEDLVVAAVAESGAGTAWSLEIDVTSGAPVGASMGTSAAVAVALLAALDALVPRRGGARSTPDELARAAHRVEVERMGRQCGVQDQLASAHGGISFITVDRYPAATVAPVPVDAAVRRALEERLVLVHLGHGHDSSAVHRHVIASLEAEAGPPPQLEPLRAAAVAARDALVVGDLDSYGRALSANTAAQAALHPELVGADARRVIDAARGAGASGWKVNGAGGSGGTVALLSAPGAEARTRLEHAVLAADPTFAVIPVALRAEGVRVHVG